MRKHFYLAYLVIMLCLAAGLNNLHAAEVTNYKESFTGLNTSKPDFAPVSWGHIVESSFDEDNYQEVYVSYSTLSSGGQSGAYLRGGSQILVYGSDAVNDLLVTPLVKGTITFYLKKNSSGGTIKLFKCTKNGVKFTRGEELALELPALTTSSWTQVSLSVDEYSYIGIRLDNMCIDEFSAANANVPDVKAVEIISVRLISPSTVYANENGVVSIQASFDIRNSGNIPLQASDYSFQMEKRSNPVVVMTPVISGSKNLAVGETTTIEATCQYTLADKTKGDRVAYDIRENLANTTKQIAFVEVIGYTATLDIRDSKNLSLSTSSVVDYEVFKGERSISFTFKNTGGAPLAMTAVNLPAGFSIDNPVFIIPSNQSVSKTITLNGEAGNRERKIDFVFEGSGVKSFTVKGNIVAADAWFEDFEKGLPADWIIPDGSNWSVASEKTTNFSQKHMTNSNVSNLTSLISPKITVKEGEVLSFYAARKNEYTSPVLQLRYSADRQNWSEIIPVETSVILPKAEKDFKPFTVGNIPAGDYYISFEAGYALLDNVYGYRLATVDHDFFIKSLKMPASGTVNHPVNVTATITNMTDKAEAAAAYKVELTENGKVVATSVATELAAKESKEFSLTYTPHNTGKNTLKLLISAIGSTYSTGSSDYVIEVKEEIAADEVIVGTVTNTGNNVPLRLGYNHSLSETIYKQEQLNLSAGSNIVKVVFPYYSTDKDLKTRVSIWLENTADGTPTTTAPGDTAKMTKVFNSDYIFLKAGSAKELSQVDFALPDGFVYTGGNLRLIVRSSATTYSSNIYFGYDSGIANTSTYKYKDPIADFPAASLSSFTLGLPVVHFYISKSVPEVSGKVTANGIAVSGTSVSLTAGDVIYSADTDENGDYTLPVYQSNKEYTLSADKIGYVVTASKLTIAGDNITGCNISLEATGANIVNANNITVSPADKSVALEGEGWTAANITSLATSLGNNASITEIDMSHIDLPSDVDARFDNINPGCLIYVKKDAIVPQAWKNVVKGNQAESVILQNKAPFNCIKPFTAKSISYSRTAHTPAPALTLSGSARVMETICLPFAVNTLPAGCAVQQYTGNAGNKVDFTTKDIQAISANVPYLFTADAGTALSFDAENAVIIPGKITMVEKDNYTYCGTYTAIADGAANNYYVFDGEKFLKAGATTNIPPFRAYFKAVGGPANVSALSIDIDGEGTTGINEVSVAPEMKIITLPGGVIRVDAPTDSLIRIYAADGRLVRCVMLSQGNNDIKGLAPGIYLVNNQKVTVK